MNTLTSKFDSRISVVSCMSNYVGSINNNCVGGMAGYITGFVDNFVCDVAAAAFISAEKCPRTASLQLNLLPATGNSSVAGAGDDRQNAINHKSETKISKINNECLMIY